MLISASALALATKTKVDEMGEQMHKLTNAHEGKNFLLILLLTMITRSFLDQVDQALVDWLSPLDFIPMQNELSSRRQQGTGQWLLESKEFLNWCSGANGVLWCSGMRKYFTCLALLFGNWRTFIANNNVAGAGKTTLVYQPLSNFQK